MTINEATKLAMERKGQMFLMGSPFPVCYEPTNTDECIIIHGPEEEDRGIRWNPTADDLMSDKWAVIFEEENGDLTMQFST